MGFTLRDYFQKQKELLDDNRLLRIRLRRAEAARDRMADLLQAAGSERLTPLVHESCRGCAYAVWRLADLQYDRHAFFLGCRKQNTCESFVPATTIIWSQERTEFLLKEPQEQSES